MRKWFFRILGIIVSLAAIANLAALFIFQYQFPESWNLPFGLSTAKQEQTETEDPFLTDGLTGNPDEPVDEGIRLEIPTAPVSYNGTGRLDMMSNVYVINADGTSANGIEVETSISEGSSRREKVITYTAVTPGGQTLTAERILNLGNRYTGPSINILGTLPFCAEGEAANYSMKLLEAGVIQADDGFDEDITESVVSSLKRYNAAEEEATILLSVTNMFNDTYETEVIVPMNSTGIVLTMSAKYATIQVGETFSALDYVDQCYDAEGNSLLNRVVREGDVNNTTPGEYPVTVYCTDAQGTKSIVRSMTVIVEQPPEETPTPVP